MNNKNRDIQQAFTDAQIGFIVDRLKKNPFLICERSFWQELEDFFNLTNPKKTTASKIENYFKNQLIFAIFDGRVKTDKMSYKEITFPHLEKLYNITIILENKMPQSDRDYCLTPDIIAIHKILLRYKVLLTHGMFNEDIWIAIRKINPSENPITFCININEPDYNLSTAHTNALKKLIPKQQRGKGTTNNPTTTKSIDTIPKQKQPTAAKRNNNDGGSSTSKDAVLFDKNDEDIPFPRLVAADERVKEIESLLASTSISSHHSADSVDSVITVVRNTSADIQKSCSNNLANSIAIEVNDGEHPGDCPEVELTDSDNEDLDPKTENLIVDTLKANLPNLINNEIWKLVLEQLKDANLLGDIKSTYTLSRYFKDNLSYRIMNNDFILSDVERKQILFPFMEKVWRLSIKFKDKGSIVKVNTEKLKTHLILIEYKLSEKFDEKFWNLFKKINPDKSKKQFVIHLQNEQYKLTSDQIKYLRKFLRSRDKDPKQPKTTTNTNKCNADTKKSCSKNLSNVEVNNAKVLEDCPVAEITDSDDDLDLNPDKVIIDTLKENLPNLINKETWKLVLKELKDANLLVDIKSTYNLSKYFKQNLINKIINKEFFLNDIEIKQILFPFMETVWRLSIKFKDTGNITLLSREILETHLILIRYKLSDKFDEKFWNLFEKINPDKLIKQFVINIQNKQYNLSSDQRKKLQTFLRSREIEPKSPETTAKVHNCNSISTKPLGEETNKQKNTSHRSSINVSTDNSIDTVVQRVNTNSISTHEETKKQRNTSRRNRDVSTTDNSIDAAVQRKNTNSISTQPLGKETKNTSHRSPIDVSSDNSIDTVVQSINTEPIVIESFENVSVLEPLPNVIRTKKNSISTQPLGEEPNIQINTSCRSSFDVQDNLIDTVVQRKPTVNEPFENVSVLDPLPNVIRTKKRQTKKMFEKNCGNMFSFIYASIRSPSEIKLSVNEESSIVHNTGTEHIAAAAAADKQILSNSIKRHKVARPIDTNRKFGSGFKRPEIQYSDGDYDESDNTITTFDMEIALHHIHGTK